MTDLSIDDFPSFFRALTKSPEHPEGLRPFRWQDRLARTVAGEGWPAVLDLPTAAGKTATLEIGVFALALESTLPPDQRTAPRRIFFVVDRRVVVDQAYERAGRIAEIVNTAAGDPEADRVLRTVAARLQELAGGGVSPLGHARLRGGIPRSNAWMRTPTQPGIITCTVDQLGSRLLFRSYDGSRRSAPIHAGLASNDVLVLLDEAHCARPFAQTMAAVARYRSWGERAVAAPWGFVLLSATPEAVGEDTDVFRLTDEERADEGLRDRIAASKPAALTVARKAKIPRGGDADDVRKARFQLARVLADQALAFLREGPHRRIAVMVNRVRTALEVRKMVEDQLDEDRSDDGGELDVDVVLMTGRMRPLDRDLLIERWKHRLRGDEARVETGAPPRPVIVVSTQSLEVGADFDFDALVTEAASLDALRQRFGRLNRFGRSGMHPAVVVIGKYQERDSGDDPIYGSALAETWKFLTSDDAHESSNDLWPRLSNREIVTTVDFGIEAMDRRLADVDIERMRASVPDAPVLLPSHLDRWVQTAPVPDPDPDPSVFLHGAERSSPQVHLVWRSDLPEGLYGDWIRTVALCPPSSIEGLPVSLHWVRRWMRGHHEVPDTEGDVEGQSHAEGDSGSDGAGPLQRIILWRGRDESKVTRDPRELRPGDTVVVPSSELGPFRELLTWQSGREPVPDLGDEAHFLARGRPTLRLHPTLLETWDEIADGSDALIGLREEISLPRERVDAARLRASLEDLLEIIRASEVTPPRWLPDVLEVLLETPFSIEIYPTGHGMASPGLILKGPPHAGEQGGIDLLLAEETPDQDDADRWSEGSASMALESHCRGVADRTERLAALCGLSRERTTDLMWAARFHDLGKADRRFQAVLRGDGLPRQVADDELLAKSPAFPTGPNAYARIRRIAGLPEGFRHELVSVRLAETDSELPVAAADRDLILHLIGSHHGHCRPFAPVVVDDDPVKVSTTLDDRWLEVSSATRLEELGSGQPERFWRLVRRYGWWGLAYLEGLLRTADHQQSVHRRGAGATCAPAGGGRQPMSANREDMHLTGPEGGNPLGFLCAVGTLRAASLEWPARMIRMRWAPWASGWRPVLVSDPPLSEEELVDSLHAFCTRGTAAQRRQDDVESTVSIEERFPHFTFDKNTKGIDPDVFRDIASRAADAARDIGPGQRVFADFIAAWGCEACIDDGAVEDTAFRTMSGSGHQYFLGTIKNLTEALEPHHVRTALLEPWRYQDPLKNLSMRWDPADEKRYALQWVNPSKDPARSKRGSVLGANRLAVEAMPLFPSVPTVSSWGATRLRTTGFEPRRREPRWAWPIWSPPLTVEVVASLLAHPDLQRLFGRRGFEDETAMRKARTRLERMGVAQVFESRRISVDYYRNFTQARAI